tara:strand:+ start:2554 stop:3381 length:828 start_codon:yes stop_codon:yes gene_type:complete
MNKHPIPNVKVIHSCDDNPYYLDFWQPMSKLWKEVFNITPVLVHVGEKDVSDEFGEVHNIKPDKSVDIHTQAQLARMWYPINEPDVLWITNDIDMFPLSKKYWLNVINEWVENKPIWTNLNASKSTEYSIPYPEYKEPNYFPICYNIALGKSFKDILKIEDSYIDFVKRCIKETKEQGGIWTERTHTPENWEGEGLLNWNVDEVLMTRELTRLISSGEYVHCPPFENHRRINRGSWIYHEDKVKDGFYIDAHSVRPYGEYHEIINRLLNLVVEQT